MELCAPFSNNFYQNLDLPECKPVDRSLVYNQIIRDFNCSFKAAFYFNGLLVIELPPKP